MLKFNKKYVLLFCFITFRPNHKKLLHIENAMQQPLELAGPPAYTLHKSMLIIVILNGILGLSGYLRYGTKCQGSISLNLPPNNRLV